MLFYPKILHNPNILQNFANNFVCNACRSHCCDEADMPHVATASRDDNTNNIKEICEK